MPASNSQQSIHQDGHHDLDLLSLRLFACLCEQRNLVKVGHRFGLMPSAISKRISRLEQSLGGTPLFKRLRHGLEPTAVGLSFFKHVQAILNSLDKAADTMRGYRAGYSGQIRLLGSASAVAADLQNDVHHFLSMPSYKDVSLQLHMTDGSDVAQLINEELYNLGVLWNVQDTGSLVCLPYRSDHLCAVVPVGHALSALPSLFMLDVQDFDILGIHSISRAETLVRRMKPKHPLPSLRIKMVLPSVLHMFKSVRAGLGVGFAPMAAQQDPHDSEGLVFIPLRDAWAKRHFVVCYKDSERTPYSAIKLAHFLSERAQSETVQI